MVRYSENKPDLEQPVTEARIVAHWDNIFKNREWGKYPDISLVRFLSRSDIFAPTTRACRALELGSGPGSNLSLLAKANCEIWCIDGSETAMAQAKSRLSREGLLSNLKGATCGQLTEIDYPASFFDLIIDIEVLSANSFEAALIISQKAIEALKPGGRFFGKTFSDVTTVDGTQVSYNYFDNNKKIFAGMGPVRISTRSDIFKLFESPTTKVRIIERDDRVFENEAIISEWCFEVEKT